MERIILLSVIICLCGALASCGGDGKQTPSPTTALSHAQHTESADFDDSTNISISNNLETDLTDSAETTQSSKSGIELPDVDF